MKPAITHSLFLVLAMTLAAPLGATAAQADRQSVHIYQTMPPLFPRNMIELGILEGDARVVISVDHTGKLGDWLVIAYTRRDFADAAVNAIKQWRFDPMRIGGEARSAQIELSIHFATSGVVVSVDGTMVIAGMFERITGGESFRPCSMKEIDAIPLPLNPVRPIYPESFFKAGVRGEVVVEFFIDQTGAVRMPAVIEADHDDLGVIALMAVNEWKFEPPTRDGRPVLVRARQLFRFGQ